MDLEEYNSIFDRHDVAALNAIPPKEQAMLFDLRKAYLEREAANKRKIDADLAAAYERTGGLPRKINTFVEFCTCVSRSEDTRAQKVLGEFAVADGAKFREFESRLAAERRQDSFMRTREAANRN